MINSNNIHYQINKTRLYIYNYMINIYKYMQQFIGRLVAAFSTGVVSWIFHYPLDLVRVRLSTDMTPFN